MTNNVRKLLFPTEEEMDTQYKEMQEAVGESCKRGLSELQKKIMHEVDMSDSARFLRGEFNKASEAYDQTAKTDEGKIRPTLVPRQIIRDIAEVRGFGNMKYGNPDNWKTVEIERYRDALCRHLLAYLDDPDSKDEESGLYHYQHLACNCAFICEMEKWRHEEM